MNLTMEMVLFFICGSAALLGTIAGFGGGIFVVPTMVIALGFPIEVAIGVTALSLFPSSLLSSLWNWKNKNIDFKLALLLEPPTVIGAVLGAILTSWLPTRPLEMIFSLFLLFLSYKMRTPPGQPSLWTPLMKKLNDLKPQLQNDTYKVSCFSAALFGVSAGVLAGLFGIGGGILKTPLMLNVFRVPVRTATATSLAMIVVTSLISGLTHLKLGHVNMVILPFAMGGFLFGAFLGLFIGVRLKDEMIRKFIALSLALAAGSTFIHAVW